MKTAVINGATGGIGQAVVKALLDAGYLVVALSRRKSFNKLKDFLTSKNLQIIVTDEGPDLTFRMVKNFLQDKAPDVYVDAVGVFPTKLITEISLEELRKVFEINFFLQVATLQPFLKQMANAGHGRVIILGSQAGEIPLKEDGLYGPSKAALHMFCKIANLELENQGVRVSILAPGGVDTEMWRKSELAKKIGEIPLLSPARVAEEAIKMIDNPPGKEENFVRVIQPGD